MKKTFPILTALGALVSRFGEDKALALQDAYCEAFWQEEDFDRLLALGCTAVRLPFTWMTLCRPDIAGAPWVPEGASPEQFLREGAFGQMDRFIRGCADRGIYVILDLHGAFGSQNGQDHSGQVIADAADVDFYENEDSRRATLALWRAVAEHYRGNPAVAACDVLNEPGIKGGNTTVIQWKYYDELYREIRSVDPDRILLFEACWRPLNLPSPASFGWENVVYEYHHYPWDYVDDAGGQKRELDLLLADLRENGWGVPANIGEFTCFEEREAWEYMLSRMNAEGLSYASWTYKTTDAGSWGVYLEKTKEKADPLSDSEEEIRRVWGPESIGTGDPSAGGMIRDVLTAALSAP